MEINTHWIDENQALISSVASRVAFRFQGDESTRKTQDVAADLAQEIALRLWKARRQFDPRKGPVEAFVYTLAKNAMIDQKRKRRPTSFDQFDYPFDTPDDSLPSPTSEEALKRDAQLIKDYFPGFSVRDRAVLAALFPESFIPDQAAKEEFRKLFGEIWESTLYLPEWQDRSRDFLAGKAGTKKNTLIDKPLQRIRKFLLEKSEHLRQWQRNKDNTEISCHRNSPGP